MNAARYNYNPNPNVALFAGDPEPAAQEAKWTKWIHTRSGENNYKRQELAEIYIYNII